MWCALKCRQGKAEEVMTSYRRNISEEILRDIFVFTYDRMRRYEGSWHLERHPMFPNYVFLETEDPKSLYRELKAHCEIAQMLDEKIQPSIIQPEEERFLRALCGKEHHLEMSEGYIRDGMTHVIRGPLMGMERRIRRIDRHKRIASVAVPDGNQGRLVTVGLEITAKN